MENSPGKKRSLLSALLQPTVVISIVANLIPIYGVLYLDWPVFPLLFLFWFENLIIGSLNAVKMLMVAPDDKVRWIGKLFYVPFFCFHYGIFTMVHGVFVFGFFGKGFSEQAFPTPDVIVQAIRYYHLEWAVLGLVLSHLISFFVNYVGHAEYKHSSLQGLMQQPYGRVAVLHITVLGAGFLMAILNSPVIGLILLMVLKIILDVRSHIKEHSTYNQNKPEIKRLSFFRDK